MVFSSVSKDVYKYIVEFWCVWFWYSVDGTCLLCACNCWLHLLTSEVSSASASLTCDQPGVAIVIWDCLATWLMFYDISRVMHGDRSNVFMRPRHAWPTYAFAPPTAQYVDSRCVFYVSVCGARFGLVAACLSAWSPFGGRLDGMANKFMQLWF